MKHEAITALVNSRLQDLEDQKDGQAEASELSESIAALASATVLLEALKEARALMSSLPPDLAQLETMSAEDSAYKIDAAIAKAEGKENNQWKPVRIESAMQSHPLVKLTLADEIRTAYIEMNGRTYYIDDSTAIGAVMDNWAKGEGRNQ